MQTINPTDNGADFIGKINDNFAECATGGSDGTIAVKVPLQGGDLKASTGYVDGRWCAVGASNGSGTWTDDNFYKYLHTPRYLSMKGNRVKSVNVPSGSTLSIFCYDDNFALLSGGVVSAVDNVPDGATYVKMQIYNASGYSQVNALDITLAAEPTWVKNTGAAFSQQWFNFDCCPPKLWDDANYTTPHALPTDGTADVDNTRYHDNAVVVLPPTYSPTGKPTKVILWFGGDGQYIYINHDALKAKDGSTGGEIRKFFAACGYAVVSCGGYTSMWKGEPGACDSSLWLSRITPAYIASVRALYDHIMDNYNFDPAVYIGGKSAGGGMLMHTAITLPFPVRAAAGLSCVVSSFDVMRWSYIISQKSWQKCLGNPDWDNFTIASSGHGSTASSMVLSTGTTAQRNDATILYNNRDIIRKYDAFGMNSDIDWDAFVTETLKLSNPFNNGADYPTSLTDVIFASTKVVPTPLKYWCATKDPAVPYTWHKIMVDWINKNGGIAEMRSYTGSDGGHATFDGSAHAVTVTPPYGESMDVPFGAVEVVEWFKRW